MRLQKNCLAIYFLTFVIIYWVPTPSYSSKPEFLAPPESSVQWVAQNMIHNGVPLSVQRFQSELSLDSVLEFYRERWSDRNGLHPVENSVNGWRVIGREFDGYYMTVQIRSDGSGSGGFIALSELPKIKALPELEHTFPRLAGSEVLSDTRSIDRGKNGLTLVMRNNYSILTNAQYLREKLQGKGWLLRKDYSSSGASSVVQYYDRRLETLEIVIASSPDGYTSIVVNQVKSVEE